MNDFFKAYHPINGFKKIKNVTKDILEKYLNTIVSSFPQEALQLFFRIRLFIRIKFLNRRYRLFLLSENERKKRKKRSKEKRKSNDSEPGENEQKRITKKRKSNSENDDGECRKKAHKMKKIVN